jgi:hypothetical protein
MAQYTYTILISSNPIMDGVIALIERLLPRRYSFSCFVFACVCFICLFCYACFIIGLKLLSKHVNKYQIEFA